MTEKIHYKAHQLFKDTKALETWKPMAHHKGKNKNDDQYLLDASLRNVFRGIN